MIKNMKKGLFFLLIMTLSYLSMAQVPNTFSYQMVIRNGNNELVANTTVGIRIGLLGGNAADTVWYEEEHKVKTNLNGLAYITIGKGNILKGAISTIDWTRGPFFIKSETDPTGGTNYSLIIVSQMLSVPYAIYAKTAEKLSTPVTESDPLFSKSIAKGITAEDTARWSKRDILDGNMGGGGGITNESDPIFNASVAKGIRSVDTAAWNNKLNLRDTLNMLRPYLRAADTASLSNRLNQKVDINQLNTNTLTLDGKVNIADTSGMLANYRTGINSKLNIGDTLNMLTPYLRDADTSSMLSNYRMGINTKVNIADTASMLNPYLRKLDTASVSNRIDLKVNIADTAGMLTPYLRKLDTASVSNRIDLKVNIADTVGMLTPYLRKQDTASVSNRINLKVNIADTAGMLTPYLRKLDTASVSNRINLKVNIADTAGMLTPYLRKLDTASVSNRINLKVNIADTAGMLNPYLRKLDTASVSDRINLKVNIADTAGMLNPYLRKLDTASVSNRINLKVNIADTAGMLTPYLRKLDTASISNRIDLKVNIADTAGMLTPYLRKLDTASVSNRINLKVNIADTAGMLTPYLRKLDTASVSNRIDLKVNIADTATMLNPYLRKLDTASVSNRIDLKVNIADTSNMLANYRSALNVKAPINNPSFTGTVSGVDKNMVGLGSVDNTSDANKPISTATQTALNGKENTIPSGTTGQYYRGDKTFQTLDKSVVGLGNVDNTSDANKPVSTATQTALNLKVNIADTASMLNPYLRKLDTASLSNRINNAGLPTTGNTTGNLLYWDGSAWVRITPGSNGQVLQINGGIPMWANPAFVCGESMLFDIDGNSYNTVQIGTQCWTEENLKTTRYRNGGSIPIVTGFTSWQQLVTGARAYYNNDSTTYAPIYGALYNWHTIQGGTLCPDGWHVPTDAEWTTLTTYLGADPGYKMKSTVTQPTTGGWNNLSSSSVTNSSGFTALPGGFRNWNGNFDYRMDRAYFWSATLNGSNPYFRQLEYNTSSASSSFNSKELGCSVRCLRD
ncbi:MAG: hypothetical protein KGQ50_03350 [Bacteroidetes bacterium]|nr:hypothetical protein [Bacteroidota bacterium]